MTADDMSYVAQLVESRAMGEFRRSLEGLFGAESHLFAVDHENRWLVEVFGEAVHEMDDELRRSLLSMANHTRGELTWVPVPERRQPTFAIAVPTDSADVSYVERLARVIAPALADQRHRFEEIEDRRRRASMSVAAELQWDLLPPRSDRFESWAVSGALEPAYDVAGDLFDYGWIGGALWAYSLDGMGHGTEATLTGSVALAAIRNARHDGEGLDEQMRRASAAVHEVWHGDRFVTGVACRLDSAGVTYVNGGHEPVRRVTGTSVSLEDLEAELPLGVEPKVDYTVQERPALEPGDGIALFSDGVVGARSSAGQAFGADALEATLVGSWTGHPPLTAQLMVETVMRHIGEERVRDDITVMIVQSMDDRSVPAGNDTTDG